MRPLAAAAFALSVALGAAAACSEPPTDTGPQQPAAPSATPLEQTHWLLVELDGKPIQMPAGAEDPYLRFLSAERRVEGFAGCNRIVGGYELDRSALALHGVAATRRFCESTAAGEQAFLAALSTTRSYRVSGAMLELIADGKVVAKLEAP